MFETTGEVYCRRHFCPPQGVRTVVGESVRHSLLREYQQGNSTLDRQTFNSIVEAVTNAWQKPVDNDDPVPLGNGADHTHSQRLFQAAAAFTIIVMLADTAAAWKRIFSNWRNEERYLNFLGLAACISVVQSLCAFIGNVDGITAVNSRASNHGAAIAIPCAGFPVRFFLIFCIASDWCGRVVDCIRYRLRSRRQPQSPRTAVAQPAVQQSADRGQPGSTTVPRLDGGAAPESIGNIEAPRGYNSSSSNANPPV